jgi:hypothetical protein
LPMAGLEPARANYGPTNFKSDHLARKMNRVFSRK